MSRARPHCHGCGRFFAAGHVCPPPGRNSQRWEGERGIPLFPPTEALAPALRLVRVYGSIRQAGFAYDRRHGYKPKSGERLLQRILHGHVQRVTADTVDRLSVMT